MTEYLPGPQVLILGGGLEVTEEGKTVLMYNSLARAEAGVNLYHSNPEAFKRAGSVFVCSGGRTWLSESGSFSSSEASLTADVLLAAGVPFDLIETEERADNTLANFLYSADILDAKTKESNGEPLLDYITQGWHEPRAHYLGNMALDRPMQEIVAPGEASLRRKLQEAALLRAWQLRLVGVEPGNREELQRRTQLIPKLSSFGPIHHLRHVWE